MTKKEEDIKNILIMVQNMSQDYIDRNYGDSEKWIRHISNAIQEFDNVHNGQPWEMFERGEKTT